MDGLKAVAPRMYGSLIILVVLLLLVIDSLRAGIADLSAHQYQRHEQRWLLNSTGSLNVAELERADQYLTNALALYPGHPDYYHLMGRLQIWKWLSMETASEQTLSTALEWLMLSANRRPYWPYLYVDEVKLRSYQLLNSADQNKQSASELEDIWMRTYHIGGKETAVIQTLLDLAFKHWIDVDWQVRVRAIKLLDESLKGHPTNAYFALSMVKKYRLVSAVCQHYVYAKSTPELLEKYCDS